MFPKFIVCITKHVPATPTTNEVNSVLEWRAADDQTTADTMLAEAISKHRTANVPAGSFGPGTVQIHGAIYVPKK